MAISYNSTARFNEDSSSSSTTTWSHTCNASDTKLIVVIGGRSSISSVTYNGVAMTLISSQFDTYQYNAVYYLDNPSTGSAYNVVATYSSANQYRSGLSVGLSGASSGIGATGTSPTDFNVSIPKTATSSITTTTDNSHIFTIPSANDGGSDTYITYGASQTEIYRNNAGNWAFRAQYKTKATAGADTTTISNNTSINNIAIMSFEIKLLSGTAYSLTCSVGSYTLTGFSINFIKALNIICSVGSYTLTGFSVILSRGYNLICSVGSYTLTGYDVNLRIKTWTAQAKSAVSTMLNKVKSISIWNNKTKN